MSTWHDITFNFEEVLTSAKMNNIDENFDALAEQVSGAPNLQVRDGTASSPGLPFRDDADTGIFRSGADTINFTVGGTSMGQIDADGFGNIDEIKFNNTESTSSSDGHVAFDSSEGLLLHRTQQPGDASTNQDYLVLDGANISGGTAISISGGGGSDSAPVTFSVSSSGITATEIDSGAVGQSELANSAVGQGETKSTTTLEELLDGGTSIRNTAAGEYGMGFLSSASTESDGNADQCGMMIGRAQGTTSWEPNNESAGTDTGENSYITLTSQNSSADPRAKIRYFQSSPPYDLGDGECGLFVTIDILPDGTLAGASIAPDPMWANNGPTNIQPDYIDKQTGKKYKRIPRPTVTREDVESGRADMSDWIAARKEAKVEYVEITPEFKNADMALFPHSWVSPPHGTICMLDPVKTHDLWLLHEDGEDIGRLIDKGFILPGNEVPRYGPPGVKMISFKWKRTQ